MNNLPNKPSELILLALHDLELCEADKNYKIAMGTWHIPHKKYCSVCFAGAVMAKELNYPLEKYVGWSSVSCEPEHKKFVALDNFRTGATIMAFGFMGLKSNLGYEFDRSICQYKDNKTKFKEDMTCLAFDLMDAGY